MSRRRYLSTDISKDSGVNRLAVQAGDFAAMLYTWMVPHAADDASLPSDPEELMFVVIPGRRDKSVEDVVAALEAMRDLQLIIWDDDGIRFPSEAFYRYQTYIKDGNRRGANQQETPQDSDNSANQRKSAQNASPIPIPIPSPVSVSHSIPEKEKPPTPLPKKAAVAAVAPNGSYRLFARFCEETDADEASVPATEKGKQLGIAKAILTEHTEDEAMACAAYLRSQHWRTGLIDLGTVKSEIGKWKMSGSPATERARASPAANGHRPVTFEQAKTDGTDAAIEQVRAAIEGSNGYGSRTVSRRDEAPRRIVPG